jgi:hypothetical protein
MKYLISLFLIYSTMVGAKDNAKEKQLLRLIDKYCTESNVLKTEKILWKGAYSAEKHERNSFRCSNTLEILTDVKINSSYNYVTVDAITSDNRKRISILTVYNEDIQPKTFKSILDKLNKTKTNSMDYKEKTLEQDKKDAEQRKNAGKKLLEDLLK